MTEQKPKPLFVGENNPLSRAPEHALYPWPPNCSGARLQSLILQVPRREYLSRFDRVDLCGGDVWDMRAARAKAAELLLTPRPVFVLLGKKVTQAFDVDWLPFEQQWMLLGAGVERNVLVLPHPSGINGAWRTPGAFERAREALRKAGAL